MNSKKIRNDLILIISLVAVLLVSLFVYKATRSEGKYVIVSKDGKITDSYSLYNDKTVTLKSVDNKTNTLVIKDGKAYIKSADCPDKICVSHSEISKVGESIVCLPHKIVVYISEDKS